MEKKDYSEFLRIMVGLSEVLGPKELSEVMLQIYWKTLKPLTLEQFKKAADIVASQNKFFPRPAEFLMSVTPDIETKAIVAFDRVMDAMSIGTYETVTFDDPAINATIHSMGGWIEFGQKEPNEWLRKDFQKYYQKHYKRILAGDISGVPTRLSGIIETSNQASGKESGLKIIYIGDPEKCQNWIKNAIEYQQVENIGKIGKIGAIKLLEEIKKNG